MLLVLRYESLIQQAEEVLKKGEGQIPWAEMDLLIGRLKIALENQLAQHVAPRDDQI